MKLTCIAADDEPLALDLINSFIRQTPFLNLAGSFSNGIETLNFIHANPVDLIFLDIQMPGLTGMELARIVSSAQQENPPRIIFTTAFNQYAIEGYKVEALDYLLKPFNFSDFSRSALKALNYYERISKASLDTPEAPVVSEEEYLFLKVEYQHIKVEFKEILYVESLGDYVKVHLTSKDKPLLSLTSLKALEDRLPKNKFMRVHRSYIIALDKINAITKNSVSIGNVTINISEQYKEPFLRFLNKHS